MTPGHVTDRDIAWLAKVVTGMAAGPDAEGVMAERDQVPSARVQDILVPILTVNAILRLRRIAASRQNSDYKVGRRAAKAVGALGLSVQQREIAERVLRVSAAIRHDESAAQVARILWAGLLSKEWVNTDPTRIDENVAEDDIFLVADNRQSEVDPAVLERITKDAECMLRVHEFRAATALTLNLAQQRAEVDVTKRSAAEALGGIGAAAAGDDVVGAAAGIIGHPDEVRNLAAGGERGAGQMLEIRVQGLEGATLTIDPSGAQLTLNVKDPLRRPSDYLVYVSGHAEEHVVRAAEQTESVGTFRLPNLTAEPDLGLTILRVDAVRYAFEKLLRGSDASADQRTFVARQLGKLQMIESAPALAEAFRLRSEDPIRRTIADALRDLAAVDRKEVSSIAAKLLKIEGLNEGIVALLRSLV